MRYRLSTVVSASLVAAALLGLNVYERETIPAAWDGGSEFEAARFLPADTARGWPVTVSEVRNMPSGRRAYFEPLAVAVNAAFALSLVAVVALGSEWLARRRELPA